MSEFLFRVQDACLQLNWWSLVLPGLAVIVLGLFLWLGGARYAFAVVGLLGAVVGAGCGFVVSQWFDLHIPLTVSAGAAIFTITAILLQQTVIVLLASIIFAAACGLAYMTHTIDRQSFQDTLQNLRGDWGSLSSDIEKPPSSESADKTTLPLPLGIDESNFALSEPHEQGIQKLKDILDALRSSAASNRNMLFVWAVLGGVVGLLIGYLLKKIVMALCCSIVGATGVITGMLALFLAKGIPVFSSLQDRPRLLLSIFIAMIIFGCLLQLFITGRAKKKTKTSQKEEK
jgi:hypothetical protein